MTSLQRYIIDRKTTALDFRARGAELARRLARVDHALRLLHAEVLTPFDDPAFEAIPVLDCAEAIKWVDNHRTQLEMAARKLSKLAHEMEIEV